MSKNKVIYLMGPTASGKTPLAIELVQQMPLEIISVDSAMVYRGMDIGTAKPDQKILEIAPHRLINILDPSENYSAGKFHEDALREIAQIHHKGNIPLLVGGTMLYFRILQQGLAQLPTASNEIRKLIKQKAEQTSWANLHAELATIDPESAKKIHSNDAQRIQRALEIYYLTGKSISFYQQETTKALEQFDVLQIGLFPNDRVKLQHKIELRFEAMLKAGLIEEVQCLFERVDLNRDCSSMRTVGYREVWSYLLNEINFDEMKQKAITSTRQLAKRQMTWLRSWDDINLFDPDSSEVSNNICRLISAFLNKR